jgi:hypothetical protein
LCANGKILVNNWNKIEGIKKTQGQSYIGEKLKGMTFITENDSNKIEMIYKYVIRIVD